MKIYFILLTVFILYSCGSNQQKDKDQNENIDITLDQEDNTRGPMSAQSWQLYGGNFSADENRILVSSSTTGDIYAVPVDGSAPKTVNSGKMAYRAIAFFPEDDRFLYTLDKDEDENNTLFVKNPDGSEIRITPWENCQNGFMAWSNDMESMFIYSNNRNPEVMDIYELEIDELKRKNPTAELVYRNTAGIEVKAISPNRRYIAMVKTMGMDTKLLVHDQVRNSTFEISEHRGNVIHNPQCFSLNNNELYYITNENSSMDYLAKVNLNNRKVEKVYECEEDVIYTTHSSKEKYRIIGTSTGMGIFEVKSGKEVKIPNIKSSDIASASISRSEKLVRLTTPFNDIYLYNLKTGQLKELTLDMNGNK